MDSPACMPMSRRSWPRSVGVPSQERLYRGFLWLQIVTSGAVLYVLPRSFGAFIDFITALGFLTGRGCLHESPHHVLRRYSAGSTAAEMGSPLERRGNDDSRDDLPDLPVLPINLVLYPTDSGVSAVPSVQMRKLFSDEYVPREPLLLCVNAFPPAGRQGPGPRAGPASRTPRATWPRSRRGNSPRPAFPGYGRARRRRCP